MSISKLKPAWIKEFKDFALKGNVVDMAIGVIVGGAFGKTGTLATDERCVCGHVLPEGSYATDYETE